MRALFVLLPEPAALDRLVAALPPEVAAAWPRLAVRVYPRASDARHLLSLVRSGRDPIATRRWPGLIAALVGGAALGALTASTLAGGFQMFGGMLEIALPFGLLVGAFLGGFTAAMTGTESAMDEVRALAPFARRGDVLVSLTGAAEVLRSVRGICDDLGWRCSVRE
jgi:hypothetical protein